MVNTNRRRGTRSTTRVDPGDISLPQVPLGGLTLLGWDETTATAPY